MEIWTCTNLQFKRYNFYICVCLVLHFLTKKICVHKTITPMTPMFQSGIFCEYEISYFIASRNHFWFTLNTLLCKDRSSHLSETWKQVNFIKRINVYLSIRGLIENISVIKQEVILIQPNLPMASGKGHRVPSYRGNCFDTSTFFNDASQLNFGQEPSFRRNAQSLSIWATV